MKNYQVMYDYYGATGITYGCIADFDTEEQAKDWIEEGRNDPFTGNFKLILPIDE